MRSKELSVELRDRIVSRHRSGEVYQNISAALNVPKNTVASIILNWKKFGTTKSLTRAGSPAKLSNRGRRALVRNLLVTLTELRVHLWRLDNLPEGQPSLQHSTNQVFYGRVARRKPLLGKRHMTALLELTKRQLKTLRPRETRFSGLMKQDLTFWPECQASRLEETWQHPYSEAWW
ncbi:unnamed protein product [Oncorhynchus mykiss]|uniref:Sleeping Beauty transposase HTH domain-containing protein n=1 Tax=Oncorhynchus mykiss TaxID=8022 RepID=A0A060WWB4_ONCMY|nr:unnamed protein product [Oncorhynchus mykiss]